MASSNLKSFWKFISTSALGTLAVFFYYSYFHTKLLSNYPNHLRGNFDPFGPGAIIYSTLLTPPLIILIRLIYSMRVDIIKRGFPSTRELTLGMLFGFVAPYATIVGVPMPITFLASLIMESPGHSVLIFLQKLHFLILQGLLFLIPNLIVLRATSLQKEKHKNPEDAWKPTAYIIAYLWIIWSGSMLFVGIWGI
jgi:hypothetical protein